MLAWLGWAWCIDRSKLAAKLPELQAQYQVPLFCNHLLLFCAQVIRRTTVLPQALSVRYDAALEIIGEKVVDVRCVDRQKDAFPKGLLSLLLRKQEEDLAELSYDLSHVKEVSASRCYAFEMVCFIGI